MKRKSILGCIAIIYIIFLNIGILNAQNIKWISPRPDVCAKFYKINNLNGKSCNRQNPYLVEPFNKKIKKSDARLSEVNNIEKILVIPLEFKDIKFKEEDIKQKYEELMEKVKDYYEVNSGYENGKKGVTIEYTVIDKITSQYDMEYYTTDMLFGLTDDKEDEIRIDKMARETVEILMDEGFEFEEFDNNKDGIVDHILIIHAGAGQEETLEPNLIWSHRWEIQDNGVDLGEVRALNYTTVPENAKLGIIVHELGHDFGLPDLYDTSNVNQGVGMWDVMGSGSWNYTKGQEPGECPSNLCAWSREFLGWANIEEVEESKELKFTNSNGISNVYKVYLRDKYGRKDKNEYYLLEYRRRLNYDEGLAGDGILIWHIDQKVIDKKIFSNELNTDGEKLGVELIQADGKFHLNKEIEANRGDGGDPFPGDTSNNVFGAFAHGLNFSNKCEYSFIEGKNFSVQGDVATVYIDLDVELPQGGIKTYAPLDGSNVNECIKFSCDLIPKCSEYKLQISTTREFDDPLQYTIGSDMASVLEDKVIFTKDFSNILEEGTKYYFRVAATNPLTKLSNLLWSEPKQVYYTSLGDIKPPSNLSWDITKEKISVSWVKEDNANGYIILLDGKEIYVKENTFEINNDEREHHLNIRSICDDSSSKWGEDILIKNKNMPQVKAVFKEEDVGLPKCIKLIIDNGTFNKTGNYNKSTVKIDTKKLPEGIKQGTVELIADNIISLQLERKDSLIIEEDVTIDISISRYLVNGCCDDLKAQITLKANNQDYVNKVRFSFSGVKKNKLVGTTKDMEFSLDGGLTYDVCDVNTTLLTEGQQRKITSLNGIIIRSNKQDGGSNYQIINILDNKLKPILVPDYDKNIIHGLTHDMEFSFDGINWDDEIEKLDNLQNIVEVRYKAHGRVKQSESVAYFFLEKEEEEEEEI